MLAIQDAWPSSRRTRSSWRSIPRTRPQFAERVGRVRHQGVRGRRPGTRARRHGTTHLATLFRCACSSPAAPASSARTSSGASSPPATRWSCSTSSPMRATRPTSTGSTSISPIGDIADADAVARAGRGCDAVVNFAAETHVDRSILTPRDFVHTDVVGTQVLLEWARDDGRPLRPGVDRRGLRRSRGAAAAPARTTRCGRRSPYSASKAGGDLQVLAYVRTYGVERLDHPRCQHLRAEPVPGEAHSPVHHQRAGRAAAARLRRRQAGARMAARRGPLRGGRARPARGRAGRGVQRRRRGAREHRGHAPDPRAHRRQPVADQARRGSRRARPPLRARRPKPARRSAGRPSTPSASAGCRETVTWYRENRAWWEPIKTGEYRAYYEAQYAERLKA